MSTQDNRRPIRQEHLPALLAWTRFERLNRQIEWDKVRRQMEALGLTDRDMEYFRLKRLLREGK